MGLVASAAAGSVSLNEMIRRVIPLISGGFWYVPVKFAAHALSSVGLGSSFQHLHATWQPLHAVHLEESNRIAFSDMFSTPPYAFSMFTRNALYSGMNELGSPTLGVRSLTVLTSVPNTPAQL